MGSYGFGWVTLRAPLSREPLLFHGGSNEMNIADILLQPARHRHLKPERSKVGQWCCGRSRGRHVRDVDGEAANPDASRLLSRGAGIPAGTPTHIPLAHGRKTFKAPPGAFFFPSRKRLKLGSAHAETGPPVVR
jgi:hypothetical protein